MKGNVDEDKLRFRYDSPDDTKLCGTMIKTRLGSVKVKFQLLDQRKVARLVALKGVLQAFVVLESMCHSIVRGHYPAVSSSIASIP